MAQTIDRIAPEQTQGVQRRLSRTSDAEQRRDIAAVHHHAAEHEMGVERRPEVGELWPEAATVIVAHVEDATRLGRTLRFGMVVRGDRPKVVGKFGMGFEKGQRLGGMIDEGGPKVSGRRVADHGIKIAQNIRARILDPGGPGLGAKGSHIAAPDSEVVPPNQGSFSRMTTSRPLTRAGIAAASAAQPEPTTTTSVSAGRSAAAAGFVGIRSSRLRRPGRPETTLAPPRLGNPR